MSKQQGPTVVSADTTSSKEKMSQRACTWCKPGCTFDLFIRCCVSFRDDVSRVTKLRWTIGLHEDFKARDTCRRIEPDGKHTCFLETRRKLHYVTGLKKLAMESPYPSAQSGRECRIDLLGQPITCKGTQYGMCKLNRPRHKRRGTTPTLATSASISPPFVRPLPPCFKKLGSLHPPLLLSRGPASWQNSGLNHAGRVIRHNSPIVYSSQNQVSQLSASPSRWDTASSRRDPPQTP